MSHSDHCLSANRFGDGFDCICEPDPSYRAGYEAGLRRAKEMAQPFLYGSELDDFSQAIDAELTKERP